MLISRTRVFLNMHQIVVTCTAYLLILIKPKWVGLFCDNCLKFIDHCSLDIQVIMRWFKTLREITFKKCHESRLLFTPLRLMMRLSLGTTTQGDDLKHRLLNTPIWRLVSYAQELNFNPCRAWKWKWWDCNIGGIFFENCNTFAA